LSFIEINSNKEKLANFDQVQTEFDLINIEHNKLMKTNNEMRKSLQLGKLINSNQIFPIKFWLKLREVCQFGSNLLN
jgi:hypothetical protein